MLPGRQPGPQTQRTKPGVSLLACDFMKIITETEPKQADRAVRGVGCDRLGRSSSLTVAHGECKPLQKPKTKQNTSANGCSKRFVWPERERVLFRMRPFFVRKIKSHLTHLHRACVCVCVSAYLSMLFSAIRCTELRLRAELCLNLSIPGGISSGEPLRKLCVYSLTLLTRCCWH